MYLSSSCDLIGTASFRIKKGGQPQSRHARRGNTSVGKGHSDVQRHTVCLTPSLLILLILAVIGLCLLFCRVAAVVLVLILIVLILILILVVLVLILVVLHMRVSSFLVRRSCGILP